MMNNDYCNSLWAIEMEINDKLRKNYKDLTVATN